MRRDAPCLQDKDVRLSRSDGVRENLWLERIENKLDQGRVLIVCGYLHVEFLTDNIRGRGGALLEKSTFPEDLRNRKPTKIFDTQELKEYLRDQG